MKHYSPAKLSKWFFVGLLVTGFIAPQGGFAQTDILYLFGSVQPGSPLLFNVHFETPVYTRSNCTNPSQNRNFVIPPDDGLQIFPRPLNIAPFNVDGWMDFDFSKVPGGVRTLLTLHNGNSLFQGALPTQTKSDVYLGYTRNLSYAISVNGSILTETETADLLYKDTLYLSYQSHIVRTSTYDIKTGIQVYTIDAQFKYDRLALSEPGCVDHVEGFYNGSGTTQYSLTLIPVSGPNIDLSVDRIDLAQVVFNPDINGDTHVDLVSGKDTVAIATVSATGVSPSETRSVGIQASVCGQVVGQPQTRTLAAISNPQTASDNKVMFFFPLSGTGVCDLEVKIDPENLIADSDRTNNSKTRKVDVKPVRNITYAYFSIDYLDPVPQFSQTVADSGDYLKAVYPIAPGQFLNEEIDISFIPASAGFLKNPLGAADDALNLWLEGMLLPDRPERIIGIVPQKWFTYHQLDDAVGVNFSFFPMVKEAAFVLDGEPLVTAHELGHSYGLNIKREAYTEDKNGDCIDPPADASGFWVTQKINVSLSTDYMGCDPGPINYPDQATVRWSTTANFSELFRQFLAQPGDPEVLLVTGTINQSGGVTFGPMYRLVDGAVSQGDPAGDGLVGIVDSSDHVVAGLPFKVDFRILDAPTITLDAAPFAFAVPYPLNAAEVQIIRDGQVLARIRPTSKLLRDAIASVPDVGFVRNPTQLRDALLNKVDAFDKQLAVGALNGAHDKLMNDIRVNLVQWLKDDYPTQSLRQYTKPAVLELVDDLLQRIDN